MLRCPWLNHVGSLGPMAKSQKWPALDAPDTASRERSLQCRLGDMRSTWGLLGYWVKLVHLLEKNDGSRKVWTQLRNWMWSMQMKGDNCEYTQNIIKISQNGIQSYPEIRVACSEPPKKRHVPGWISMTRGSTAINPCVPHGPGPPWV